MSIRTRILGLVVPRLHSLVGGCSGSSIGIVSLELVAIDEDDAVDPGLGDQIEDVASGATDSHDRDGVASEEVVEIGQAGAR